MIKKECICDKCGDNDFANKGFGIYTISHTSLDNHAIMGDNRIMRDKHFCRDCFGKYIAPLLTPNI